MLCLGFLLFPADSEPLRSQREIALPPGVWWIEFDTAGTATLPRYAFGMLAPVAAGTPLATLAVSYYGSELPGYTGWMDWKTPFTKVQRLAQQLEAIGLHIDENEHANFCEAMIPIEFQAAWSYVESQNLAIVLDYDPRERPRSLELPKNHGLTGAIAVQEYLNASWQSIRDQLSGQNPLRSFHWHLGLMIIENSD